MGINEAAGTAKVNESLEEMWKKPLKYGPIIFNPPIIMDSCLTCGHSNYKEGETRLKTMANFQCNWDENRKRPHWLPAKTIITIQSNQPYIDCPAFIERKD